MSGLRLEHRPDGIAILTFDRPHARNAVDRAAITALATALDALERDDGLGAVVVTGDHGTFVSGGDVKALLGGHDRHSGEAFSRAMSLNLDRLAGLPVPVLAAIEGAALGGGLEIALACDLRVCAEDALLSFRQVRMAVTPGWGGGLRLVGLVGRARALRLLWEGRDLSPAQARDLGLVDELTPSGGALDRALQLAAALILQPRGAIRGAKRVVEAAVGLPVEEARLVEREVFLDTWASADHTEAARAFLERRPPRWTGR